MPGDLFSWKNVWWLDFLDISTSWMKTAWLCFCVFPWQCGPATTGMRVSADAGRESEEEQ